MNKIVFTPVCLLSHVSAGQVNTRLSGDAQQDNPKVILKFPAFLRQHITTTRMISPHFACESK
jgi:hypothetical protein